MNILSPITKNKDVTLIGRLSRHKLVKMWHEVLSIDISSCMNGVGEEIYLYKCNQTNLLFYYPQHIAATDFIYNQLQKYDWYYMVDKWEHGIAAKDLQGCQKVLEIGAGKGAFVKRLINELSLDAIGLELNADAVKYCKQKDIPVFGLDLFNFAGHHKNEFDAVCTFQVLEHVSDPLTFLSNALQLIKPGGKLIVSVPNQDSFIRYETQDLLNMPPHHMTRWHANTFKEMEKILPLSLEKVRYEPLASYHVDWFFSVNTHRFSKYSLQGLLFRMTRELMSFPMKDLGFLRQFIIGHTLYIVFRKN